jgi:hypothetical protein
MKARAREVQGICLADRRLGNRCLDPTGVRARDEGLLRNQEGWIRLFHTRRRTGGHASRIRRP